MLLIISVKNIVKYLALCVLCITLVLIAPQIMLARPVSYPGGWTTMLINDTDISSLHVHYSSSIRHSIGYKGVLNYSDSFSMHALQLNTLIKRWNMRFSQSNLYLKMGGGFTQNNKLFTDQKLHSTGFLGLSFDAETRRFFISYENQYQYIYSFYTDYSETIMLGISPYLGSYGDLHTWFMVHINDPFNDDKREIIPIIRFFKGFHLVEIGIANLKKILFNWIVRF